MGKSCAAAVSSGGKPACSLRGEAGGVLASPSGRRVGVAFAMPRFAAAMLVVAALLRVRRRFLLCGPYGLGRLGGPFRFRFRL